MPDFRLTTKSPLGGVDQTLAGVRIREVNDRALAWIAVRRGQDDRLHQVVRDACEVELPGPGWRVAGPTFAFAWTAPGQWLVEAPLAEHEGIASTLESMLGETAAVAEQTDAFAVLEVSGEAALASLEKLCPLDLHTSAFPTGRFQRTLIEHLSVFIGHLDDRPTFLLLVPRSSARFFHQALCQAMLSQAARAAP